MKQRLQLLIIVFFSFVAMPLMAHAAETPPAVQAFLDALTRQYNKAGGELKPTFGEMIPDGNGGATITNIESTFVQKEFKGGVKINKVVLSGATKNDNGTWSFKSINLENAEFATNLPDIGPIIVKVPSATTTNVHLLPVKSADGIDYSSLIGTIVYEASTVPVVNFTVAGQSFDAKNLVTTWQGDPSTGLGVWNTKMDSVIIPVDAIPNPKFQKDMKETFGYNEFNLSFDGNFAVKGANQKLDVAYALRLTGKNIGSFDFAFAAQDIPAKLLDVLKEVQAGQEPKMGKMMPLLIGIKLSHFKFGFVDDSITNKMLDFAAKKRGTTREALAANGAAMLQIGLGQIRAPEFTKSVIAAYNAFVKNPKNITLEAKPESPVAMAALMGMMGAPAAALQVLGVSVVSNQ